MRKVLIVLPVLYFVTGSLAFGNLSMFRPRLITFTGRLTTELSYESEKYQSSSFAGGGSERSSTGRLRESLTLGTAGYLYHPDLLIFGVDFGTALQQSRNESGGPAENEYSSFEQYSIEGQILRKKKYNASFYSKKEIPLLTSGYGEEGQLEFSSNALVIHYDDFNVNGEFSYYSKNREDNDYSWQDQSFSTFLTYHDKELSEKIKNFRVTMRSSLDRSTTQDEEKTSKSFSLVNHLNYQKNLKFITVGTVSFTDRDSSSQETISFGESVSAALPWNFNLGGNVGRRDSTHENMNTGEVRQQETDTMRVALRQKLFKSLNSEMSVNSTNNSSSQGDYRRDLYKISTEYNKKLLGGMLSGGLSNTINEIQQQGRIFVDEEGPYQASVTPGTNIFLLKMPDVDLETLLVEVEIINVNGAAAWVPLTMCQSPENGCESAGEDWSVVDPDGTPFAIRIEDGFTLRDDFTGNPSYLPPIDWSQMFNFRVSYYTLEADYKIQTDSTRFNSGITLFENILDTDYEHIYTSQKIIEGDPRIRGLSPDVTEDKFTVKIEKAPFKFTSAYRKTSADYDEDSIEFGAWFTKGLKIVAYSQSTFMAHYGWLGSNIEKADGTSGKLEEYEYDAAVRSTLNVPRTKITVGNSFGYEKKVGNIPIFVQNELGYYTHVRSLEEEKDRYFVNFDVTWRSQVPLWFNWAKVWLTVSGLYELDSDRVWERKLLYNLSTGPSWTLGATVISLSAKYGWDWTEKRQKNGLQFSETEGKYSILLRVTRILF